MAQFSYAELADMHFIYGKAEGNGRRAERLYAARFPARRHPDRGIFSRIHLRLCESGSLKRQGGSGQPFSVRSVEFEEEVLQRVEENPYTSVRAIAYAMGAAAPTVWRVLHDQQLYPYHLQKVQAMGPEDYPHRLRFSRWWLQQNLRQPDFGRYVLFTDEACFTRDGFFNSRNSHIWDDENPHAIALRRDQHQFSVNVWAGIVGENIIGPYLLPPRLNGHIYVQFLEQILPEFLEDVPLNIRRGMWFQHDGAPAHFSLEARQYLNEVFRNRWIGRGGPVHWPARSPDLTALDFFLWGHVKSLVYETPIPNAEELLGRVMAACAHVQDMPGIFHRVRTSMNNRAQLCMEQNGRHIEPLML